MRKENTVKEKIEKIKSSNDIEERISMEKKENVTDYHEDKGIRDVLIKLANEEYKIVDLAIGSGGHINLWSKGFFEESAKMAGNKFNEDDYIIIGQFRIKKRQYEDNKEKFDKYMKGFLVSQNKEAPVESKPIGRIDYLHTDGRVRESIEYTSPYQFEKDIEEENYYGVPMKIVLYKDRDGTTIQHDFISQLDPPPQGVEIIDSPYLKFSLDTAKLNASEPKMHL